MIYIHHLHILSGLLPFTANQFKPMQVAFGFVTSAFLLQTKPWSPTCGPLELDWRTRPCRLLWKSSLASKKLLNFGCERRPEGIDAVKTEELVNSNLGILPCRTHNTSFTSHVNLA